MTNQQQRTQWALDLLASFVLIWTPPGALAPLRGGLTQVETAIRAIAPKGDDDLHIGYGVFHREIDADWDIRQRPSGYVHELVSAVFDKPGQADNAHQALVQKYPDKHYVICEIQEIP